MHILFQSFHRKQHIWNIVIWHQTSSICFPDLNLGTLAVVKYFQYVFWSLLRTHRFCDACKFFFFGLMVANSPAHTGDVSQKSFLSENKQKNQRSKMTCLSAQQWNKTVRVWWAEESGDKFGVIFLQSSRKSRILN